MSNDRFPNMAKLAEHREEYRVVLRFVSFCVENGVSLFELPSTGGYGQPREIRNLSQRFDMIASFFGADHEGVDREFAIKLAESVVDAPHSMTADTAIAMLAKFAANDTKGTKP